MAQINKVMRERFIKQVSRSKDLKPAKEKISPKAVPKIPKKSQGKVGNKEPAVPDTPAATFKAAQRASITAIRNTRTLSEKTDKSEDQEAIENLEYTGRDAVFDSYDTAKDAKDSIKRQIRKKRPDIKNTKDIKTASRTIKKANRTVSSKAEQTRIAAKSTIEASRQAVATSQKVASARKAEHLTQKAAESVKKIVKGLIKAIKELGSALGAATVPIMLIIVIAATIAAIVSSSLGIFFTGDASAEGSKTLREVILEINQEYNQYIEDIQESVTHDELVMEGYQSSWKDVLAIYAVYVTTKDEGATDVVHMTEENSQILYDIFWSMNTITYTTEERTVTEKVPDLDEDGNQKVDEDGNPLYVEQEKTIITLHILLDHVTAEEQANVMYFNDVQMSELAELLDPKNDPLWEELLKGIGQGSNELVNLALSQLGNEGGEKFWKWAGLEERCPWCALFVSWCADQLGLLSSGQMPYFSFVGDGMTWFQEKGQWISGSDVDSSNYEKVIYPGMIIFFDWLEEGVRDGGGDHVGIVTKVENGYIYTVEGNRGDAVAEGCYPVGSDDIIGFGFVV